jgi:hypothetical protein
VSHPNWFLLLAAAGPSAMSRVSNSPSRKIYSGTFSGRDTRGHWALVPPSHGFPWPGPMKSRSFCSVKGLAEFPDAKSSWDSPRPAP